MLPRSGYRWEVYDSVAGVPHDTRQPGLTEVPGALRLTDSDLVVWTEVPARLKNAAELRPAAAAAKIAAVNVYAATLIGQGFSYGGQTFSLSPEAQRNLLDLRASAASLTWPLTYESADDLATVELADQAAGLALYNAAWAQVRSIRAAAKLRKTAVRAALADPDPAAGLAAIAAVEVPW